MPSHPLGQWQPCPSCCSAGCPHWSDEFNRTSSTDLGANWDEVVGDSEIQTGSKLMIPASGLAICNQRPWGLKASQWIHPTILNRQPGDVNIIVANYCDVDNFFWVSVWRNTVNGSNGTATLGVREAGVDRILKKPAPEDAEDAVISLPDGSAPLDLYVCYNGDQFSVNLAGTSAFVRALTFGVAAFPWGDPVVERSGLGSGSGNASYFDSFVISEEHHTNRECPKCCCDCDADGTTLPLVVMPPTLNLVIEAHDDPNLTPPTCQSGSSLALWLDGRSCYLDANITTGVSECGTWVNDGEPRRDDANKLPYNPPTYDPSCPYSAMSAAGYLLFTLDCALALSYYRLHLQGVNENFCPAEGWAPNANSTCLYLEFGPFDFGCCQFSGIGNYGHIIVTFKITA